MDVEKRLTKIEETLNAIHDAIRRNRFDIIPLKKDFQALYEIMKIHTKKLEVLFEAEADLTDIQELIVENIKIIKKNNQLIKHKNPSTVEEEQEFTKAEQD